jgi:hypothetical protein
MRSVCLQQKSEFFFLCIGEQHSERDLRKLFFTWEEKEEEMKIESG